jgi:4-carboxymuconolactone decarboxylase
MGDSKSPRVPFVTDKDDVPPDQHHNYDKVVENRGRVIGPFGVLLNSPEIAGRAGHLGSYIRFESELPGDVRELAILMTAREHDCAFEWAIHEPIAREVGVSTDAIEVVEERANATELSADERLIIVFGRELLRENEIGDRTFEAARKRFGDVGVTELAATFGYYSMLAVVLNALEVVPADDRPALD